MNAPEARWEPSPDDLLLEDFTGSAREISGVIGTPAMLALLRWRGGGRIKVPASYQKQAGLRDVIGARAAHNLSSHFKIENIYLPTLRVATLKARNRKIRKDYDSGVSVIQLISRYGLCERQVRMVLSEP